MSLRPAAVIAGWTSFNLLLASVMFAFGENTWFIGMYFVAALPLLVLALIASVVDQRQPTPPTEYRIGQRAGLMLPLSLGLLFVGIGVIYVHWVAIVGAVIALFAAVAALRRPATATAEPDSEVLPYPLHPGMTHPPPGPTNGISPDTRRRGKIAVAGLITAIWAIITRPRRRRTP